MWFIEDAAGDVVAAHLHQVIIPSAVFLATQAVKDGIEDDVEEDTPGGQLPRCGAHRQAYGIQSTHHLSHCHLSPLVTDYGLISVHGYNTTLW